MDVQHDTSRTLREMVNDIDVQHDDSRPLADMVDDDIDVQHDTSQPLRAAFFPVARGATPASAGSVNTLSTGPSLVTGFPGYATPAGQMGTPWPTDASGAAGPNHYMQTVNFSAVIYDKAGNIIMGPFSTAQFWNGFAGPCGGGWTDVVVLYDRAAQRWFVSRFANPGNGWYQCFAISQTPDPTGAYFRYAFLMDPLEFNDYPKFGIWPDAYYMTADRNKIFPGLGNFAAAFDRNNMLLGQPAGSFITKLSNNGNRAGMLPADWDGHTPPPTGSPGYFARTLDTNLGWPSIGLEIYTLQVDWVNSVFNFSLLTTLTPAAFNSAICGLNQNCIPQPGTAEGLDPLAGGRPMFRLAYRNFGNHETLTFNQTVDAGNPANHAGIRWYELRKSGGSWSIFQQGTLAPDADHRWLGSLAMDQAGNMALGYNVSGSVFPSIRIAGRLAGDLPGSMSEALTMKAGSGAQTGFVLWGDYSHMSLDPVDDCTFYYVGAFQPVTSNLQSWATQIGTLRFPSCTADLSVTKTRSPVGPVTVGTNVTYTVTVINNGPNYAGNVTLTDAVPAGTGFVSLTFPAGWTCTSPAVGSAGTITCNETSLAVGEVATFKVVATVNCDVADGTQIGNTASVSAATPPDNNPNNNNSTVSLTAANPTPIFTKAFSPPIVQVNKISTLTFTLTNPSALAAATSVGFTDPLPAGLSGNTLGINGCGAGALFGINGSTITLSSATIAASGTCTAQIAIVANAPGVYMNVSEAVMSGACTGGTASASLTALLPPTITKAFADSQVELFFGATDLSFTITNPAANPLTLTGIAFTDTLPGSPPGLIVSTPDNGLMGSCGGGTITALPASNSISLSGATLAPGASCTISVDVTGAAIGVQNNTTSNITASGPINLVGSPATATTSVVDTLFFWFFAESGGGRGQQ
jgi:uncharacterized repeat protein (TIGR01451 family)